MSSVKQQQEVFTSVCFLSHDLIVTDTRPWCGLIRHTWNRLCLRECMCSHVCDTKSNNHLCWRATADACDKLHVFMGQLVILKCTHPSTLFFISPFTHSALYSIIRNILSYLSHLYITPVCVRGRLFPFPEGVRGHGDCGIDWDEGREISIYYSPRSDLCLCKTCPRKGRTRKSPTIFFFFLFHCAV